MINTRYGNIEVEECDLFDELIQSVAREFGGINFLEIGVNDGKTARGVARKAQELNVPFAGSGVDIGTQIESQPENYTFYHGDSMDVWPQVIGRFNFLFIDGCHCANHVMADFLNYSPLVAVKGICAFHDVGRPELEAKQKIYEQPYQDAKWHPGKAVCGVRMGLRKLGLLNEFRSDWTHWKTVLGQGELLGVAAFRKVKELW